MMKQNKGHNLLLTKRLICSIKRIGRDYYEKICETIFVFNSSNNGN